MYTDTEHEIQFLQGIRSQELHYSEKWFHGKLAGGRKRSDELLREYSHTGDGTFLVRESDTFVGDFSLSFWYVYTIIFCANYVRGRVSFAVLLYTFGDACKYF